MITKEEIGRRIKKIREQQHLTLKNVEAKAGISATHISEIERGKTSPTIGALMRIADALGKDPAYFIEDEELKDVSFIALEDREKTICDVPAGEIERLTNSIPSGKIDSRLIRLAPDDSREFKMHSHDADEAVLVLSGSVRFMVEDEEFILEEGDSIYYVASQNHGYANASDTDEARMIWFASERGVD
jgi:transcriptional regulator with XRE-family HTH domain